MVLPPAVPGTIASPPESESGSSSSAEEETTIEFTDPPPSHEPTEEDVPEVRVVSGEPTEEDVLEELNNPSASPSPRPIEGEPVVVVVVSDQPAAPDCPGESGSTQPTTTTEESGSESGSESSESETETETMTTTIEPLPAPPALQPPPPTTTTTQSTPAPTPATPTKPATTEPSPVPRPNPKEYLDLPDAPRTASEADKLLEQNSAKPGQITAAQQSAAALEHLRRSLQQFHAYVQTPAATRAPTFSNDHFRALSKLLTKSTARRVGSALAFVERMQVTGKNVVYTNDLDVAQPSLSALYDETSHAMWHVIDSLHAQSSEKRKSLAMALIANVIQGCSQSNKNGIEATIVSLTRIVMSCLISEGIALSAAAVVAQADDNEIYKQIIGMIERDLGAFLDEVASIKYTSSIIEKTLTRISDVSKKFEAAAVRYAPIGNDGGGEKRSFAMVLAVNLCRIVEQDPTYTKGTNQDFYLKAWNANLRYATLLLPKTIVYPLATYDVLSGFLEGIRAAILAAPNATQETVAYVRRERDNYKNLMRDVVEKVTPHQTVKSMPSTQQAPVAIASNKRAQSGATAAATTITTAQKTDEKTAEFKRRFEAKIFDD